jgi:hypothetical protein
MRALNRIGVCLLAFSAGAAHAVPPRLSAGAAVAGGADNNLNGSVEASEKVAAAYGQVTASAGLSAGPISFKKSLGVSYRFRSYPSVPSLASHMVVVSGMAFATPRDWVSLMLSPRVSGRWVADPALRVVSGGLGTGMVIRPIRGFSWRVGYDLSLAAAEDPVYGGTLHQASSGFDIHPVRRTWLDIEYSVGVGPTVRYVDVDDPVAAGSGQGDGPGTGDPARIESDVFGADQLAIRLPATTHTVMAGVEQGLTDAIYVRARAGATWIVAEDQTAQAVFGEIALGVRLR